MGAKQNATTIIINDKNLRNFYPSVVKYFENLSVRLHPINQQLDFNSAKKSTRDRHNFCSDVKSWFLNRSKFGQTCIRIWGKPAWSDDYSIHDSESDHARFATNHFAQRTASDYKNDS